MGLTRLPRRPLTVEVLVGWRDLVDRIQATVRSCRDRRQGIDFAISVLRKRKNVWHVAAHIRGNCVVHGPLAVTAFACDEQLPVHGSEALRPITKDVLAIPGFGTAAIDITTGNGDALAAYLQEMKIETNTLI